MPDLMRSHISVGDRIVGPEHPTYIIAEAGINHNGSLQIARELVDMARDAGADAVKFQKRTLSETYMDAYLEDPSIGEMGVEYTLSNLQDVQLSDAEFERLKQYCDEQAIEFLCSPWDVPSVAFLETLGVPAYKIGSPDLTNFVLLEAVLATDKPILLSTGMADESEIERSVAFLRDRGATFMLFHCRSTYPAPFHNLDLRFMRSLMDQYDVPVGYSGHERGIAVSTAAVAMGAVALERHITLARDMQGPDHAASLGPGGIRKLVRDVRAFEESLGSSRRYMSRGEYNNRVALAKCLVAAEEIDAGTTIGREMLTARSPAKGISPQHLYDVVGADARTPIAAGQAIAWSDIAEAETRTYDTSLDGWGVVVRHADIDAHDWGGPAVFEVRINGADLDAAFATTERDQQLGIHAPEQQGHEIVDLSATIEPKRRWAVEVLQAVIDKTRTEIAPSFPHTDTPPIIIHPGGITEHRMTPEAIPEMNRALERSLSELDAAGVELLVENMPPLPWIYGGQRYHNNLMAADEIAAFCERTGVRICYDTSHAKLWCTYADVDLIEHAATLAPHTAYLHIADAAGVDGEGLQIGEGEIDWAALQPVFADFTGPRITEIWRGHERAGAGFKLAAERLVEHGW
jgi:N-acetylneuraminate synthase